MTRADLQQFKRDLQAACDAVSRNGGNREAALRELQPYYVDLTEVEWVVDAFIAGLVSADEKMAGADGDQ